MYQIITSWNLADQKKETQRIIDEIKIRGYKFNNCIRCNAKPTKDCITDQFGDSVAMTCHVCKMSTPLWLKTGIKGLAQWWNGETFTFHDPSNGETRVTPGSYYLPMVKKLDKAIDAAFRITDYLENNSGFEEELIVLVKEFQEKAAEADKRE